MKPNETQALMDTIMELATTKSSLKRAIELLQRVMDEMHTKTLKEMRLYSDIGAYLKEVPHA
jgi:hypothetical protein